LVSLLWTQRQDIGPSARYGHALAFDSGRNRTMLVGGDAAGALLHDTWLWDGENWTQVEDIGPSGRAGHAIAYDSVRQRVVLFGGKGASALADTWEWDGEAWTQVEDTGPSARSRHALAYDAARQRIVLFGGEDAAASVLDDTWVWDGDEWTQVADTGPPPRAGHAMCFEAPAARTILFGGTSASDTWAWDGSLWTALNDVGPAPCEGTAAVSVGATSILFGGVDPAAATPTLFRLTWELDGSDWTERQDMGPAPRFGHGMAFDSARSRIVLFGGGTAPPATLTAADLVGDTWELPVAAGGPGPGGPEPTVTLVSFAITPDTIASGSGEPFTLTVGLDQPAPTDTAVDIAIEGTPVGSMTVSVGMSTADATVSETDMGLPPGSYTFSATLGPVTLQAVLTIL
jgi:hypothetical protein